MRNGGPRAITRVQAVVALIIVAVAALAGGVYAGQLLAPKPAAAQSIKMGLLTHLSGPVAPTGLDILRGFQLAVEETNAKGGVYIDELKTNLLITQIVEDQQSSRDGTIAAASRLVSLHKVDVIIGGFGSAFIIAARKTITEAKTPYVITGVSTPQVVAPEAGVDPSWLVLYQEVGPGHGASIARILAETARPAVAPNRNLKAAALLQDSPFGNDFWKGMEGTTKDEKLPIEWVYVGKFKVGEKDYRSLLTAAQAAKPDVIVPVGFIGETIDSIKQAVRDLGIKTLYGPVCVCVDEASYYKDLGRDGEYSLMQTYYGPYHYNPAVKDKVEKFRAQFKERWGVLPGSQGISAYDAVFVAVEGIKRAGSLDKSKIRDALQALEMPQLLIPVPGGKIKFGDKRQQGFQLYAVQLLWDESAKELRPVIIWPKELKQADIKLPPDYKPGA